MGGRGQRPFETFPKIHPFWYRHPSHTMTIGMMIIIVYLFRASQEPHDWAEGSPTGAEHVAVPVNPDEFQDLRHIIIISINIFTIFF